MRGPNLIPSLPQTIDPLAPGPHGRYDDHLVSVLCAEPPCGRAANAGLVVRTDHFCLTERGRRIEVTHWLSPDQLDNDVAGLLAEELFAPGWLSGVEIFERVFTGVVRSCVDDPLLAWSTFYGNTLARIRQCWRAPSAAGREPTTIGELAPVYAHALQLIPAGQVLDLGSCFGFLALLLAERPVNTVTASDLSGGTMGLLGAVAAARGLQVNTLVCDAARIPVPDGWADTVSVIHLLEHVSPGHGRAVIAEALRVARHQVVVAVPVEDEPTAAYGHIRTFDLRQLRELGDQAGQQCSVHEHHGGWLVLTVG
ncbi:MAG TPA: mycofactocin oligosaccharide methyltransferase MftM [Streptosporangiaceae bacterium]|jgi:SAM-dependent methyltransferase|nr:mycofactocin oligosaccharide methyltransferase MftM [Streptosporangiaceae bacterium]